MKRVVAYTLSMLALMTVGALGAGSAADDPAVDNELVGTIEMRFGDSRIGVDDTFFLLDAKKHKTAKLDLSGFDTSKLKLGKPVKIKGSLKDDAKTPKTKMMKAKSLVYEDGAEGSISDEDSAVAGEEPIVLASDPSPAPPSATTLSCLLIFADTLNYTPDPALITKIENQFFNNANNVSAAMLHATYGHYNLAKGAVITVTLDVDTTGMHWTTAEDLMVDEATIMGYDFNNYDRTVVFTPAGVQAYTAWGYYPTLGRTVFSYDWAGKVFDNFLHELGHNFGLRHTGSGTDEYGDYSTIMGLNWTSSTSGGYTGTFGGHHKLQMGWFAPFPGSYAALTQDATYDIYPESITPDTTPGMRLVQIGGTDYFISYRRYLPPYGWLRYSTDGDKVYVRSAVDQGSYFDVSWRKAALTSGSYAAGTTAVIFERYGPSKTYATVSFDLPDGNTKPVANAQSVTTTTAAAHGITLTGSDGNGDSLTYTVVESPLNGSLSGTAPNLTYTSNAGFSGSDSFVFKVHDGLISSFATVSLTVNEANAAPVADDQSVTVYYNTPETITLTASDGNNDELTYAIVAGPGNGSLSGTAPTVTYTPDTDFSGSDSFTFKANDGTVDSNIATVSVTVSNSPNMAPSVTIETLDQSVILQAGTGISDPVAGAYFEWDAAADTGGDNKWTSSTANTYDWTFASSQTPVVVADPRFDSVTQAYEFPAAKDASSTSFDSTGGSLQPATFEFVLDVDGNNGSIFETGGSGDGMQVDIINGVIRGTVQESTPARVSYALTATDLARFIHVVFVADNVNQLVQLYVDGDLKDSQPWTAGNDWSGTDGASLGGVNNSLPTGGSVTDFSGKIATFRYYQNKAFTASEVTTNFYSLSGPSVSVSLNATVTDPEDTPTTIWTRESGVGTVGFGDATAEDTTASFAETGIYVLRLTADDGYSQVYDEVTITVLAEGALTVTYDDNGSDGGVVPVDTNAYTAGASVTVLGNTGTLVKAGCTFDGWNTSPDGSGSPYVADDTFTINAATTLYAQWTTDPIAPPSYYRMEITFTNLVDRGTLTNFPALVQFTPGNTDNYTGFLDPTNGWDLRFWTNSSLTGAELNYEIETFGTNGTSCIWVQVPELTQNRSIWASWGDVANTNQQPYTTNGAVWADYHAVYHLNGTDGSGKWPDSSGNGAHLTQFYTVTEVAGVAGSGAQMDGKTGDSYERLTHVIAGAPSYNQWTVTLFAKARNATGEDVREYVGVFNNKGTSTNSFQIDFDLSSSYQYRGSIPLAIGAPATNWQMIAVSQDASAPLTQTYFNGLPVATGAVANNQFGQFSIGNNRSGNGSFAGIVDEVRISSVTRSSNYVWACYMNQGDNHASFQSYGPPTAVGGQGTNWAFTVSSSYGNPNPSGTTNYEHGTVITFEMPVSSIVEGGTTQYVANGWVSTGSLESSATGTIGSFAITNDTTMSWQWTTNYYIEFQTLGE